MFPDELATWFAHYRLTGFPIMPGYEPARRAGWGGPAMDRAISEGARNGARFPGSVRVGMVSMGDFPQGIPETPEAAREMQAAADLRVALADPGNRDLAWARESARRAEVERQRREAERQEDERRMAEADAAAFRDRVE